MSEAKLKVIAVSNKDVIAAFDAIAEAIAIGEANHGTEGSNRVEEDWRIIQKVFAARALIEDIHEQLRPWANAFGFNPREPEEVKLSWSLTVGKAVGICQELMRELSPGWQSRGRIGSNHPNTIDGLLEALSQINQADLNKALTAAAEQPEETGGASAAETKQPTPSARKNPEPPAIKASQRSRRQPLRKPETLQKNN